MKGLIILWSALSVYYILFVSAPFYKPSINYQPKRSCFIGFVVYYKESIFMKGLTVYG